MPRDQRPTNGELEERIDFVAGCIANCWRMSRIKKAFREQFGETDHATILRYVARAKQRHLAHVGQGIAEHRSASVALYRSVIEEATRKSDKVSAQARLDKVLGLELEVPEIEKVAGLFGLTVPELVEEMRQARARRDARLASDAPAVVDTLPPPTVE